MDGTSIVVGYDGSPAARSALQWAAESAVCHWVPLRLVYAEPGVSRVKPAADPRRLPPAALIARGVEQARARCGGKVPVTGVLVDGVAAKVLAEQSQRARMLVLGSRGRGGLAGLLAGSVSAAVASRARCPVVVLREDQGAHTAGSPVGVAVDDSSAAQAALDFALAEAAARAVDVVAVRVWDPSSAWERSGWDDSSRETAERHALEASLRGWPEKYPTVPISGRVIAGDPDRVLAEVSEGAQLLAVGGHGAVGLCLLHHAKRALPPSEASTRGSVVSIRLQSWSMTSSSVCWSMTPSMRIRPFTRLENACRSRD